MGEGVGGEGGGEQRGEEGELVSWCWLVGGLGLGIGLKGVWWGWCGCNIVIVYSTYFRLSSIAGFGCQVV